LSHPRKAATRTLIGRLLAAIGAVSGVGAAPPADAVPAARAALEARVLAVRDRLERATAAEPGAGESPQLLAQWFKWNNWNNWNNWPKWGKWGNWFNR
jgi:hypothetical protein